MFSCFTELDSGLRVSPVAAPRNGTRNGRMPRRMRVGGGEAARGGRGGESARNLNCTEFKLKKGFHAKESSRTKLKPNAPDRERYSRY